MQQRTMKYGVAVVFGLLLFGLVVIGLRNAFTAKVPGANDFYPRWRGAQLFWQEGADPYSEAVTLAIQEGIYGRPATPEEDQVLFVYPFYTVFFLLPISWLNYEWAQPVWLALVMLSVFTAVLLTLKLIEWKMPLWLLTITLIWAIFFYNSSRTVILGQFAGPVYLAMVAALLALKHDRDAAAGLLLALSTIKPQMTFLLVIALLIWAVGQRRWHFIGSFIAAMLLLTGFSFALLPGWLFSFVDQVLFYPAYTFTGSSLWVITGYYWPWLGKPVENGLILLLMAYLIWQWRKLWQLPLSSPQFLIIISLTLIITNMVVVRTATTNYIIMYVPLFLVLKAISGKWRRGDLWAALILLGSIVGMWALFLASVQGDTEHPIMYLPLPFLLLPIMIWTNYQANRGRLAAI
ncbi:MAG TPA: DUF2029 domain-containing protein [Anaerolineae bacterium]|nr:DUF2029 domain-containing protein [Anaerolineae bacterium]